MPTTTLRPRALRPGDRVGVATPSDAITDRAALARGLRRLRDWGLRPVVMPHTLQVDGKLPPYAKQKAADVQAVLDDPDLRALFAACGGSGAIDVIERVDLSPLRDDPKPLIGFSDITVLLAAAWKEVGLIGFHGPTLVSRKAERTGVACAALQHDLVTDRGGPTLLPVDGRERPRTIVPGFAEGPLLGGNLRRLCSLLDTPWELELDGAILFLEDVDEAPCRIDAMLGGLLERGHLQRCAAIALGDFHVTATPLASRCEAVYDVACRRLGELGIPVACDFAFGHRPRSWTLPFGGFARLDASDPDIAPELVLLEPAVA